MNNFYKEGAWWASPYNQNPDVVEKTHPKQNVTIHDATLRDGEQTPGVVFSADDKLRIVEKLISVGVTRIEAGMPAVSDSDFQAVKRISSTFPEASIYSFVRAMRKDLDMSKEAGAKGVVIEIPIGYPKLQYQFGWTWENVLEKSVDCINYARSIGLETVYFPYDATRARAEDIENLLSGIMKNSPPDSIGVVDTMGCALPQTIEYMVKWYKRLCNGIPVEVHCHNDFGMAVACELAGIAAGADVVHTCVNGLGERTGNAALEEMILGMNILLGMETQYKPENMLPLCRMVEEISGVKLANNKPFAGVRNYTRESGIGVDLVVKEPLAMFATCPAYFGRQADVVLGKKSGKASVQYYLEKNNLTATEDQISAILARIKQMGTEQRRLISNDEFLQVVKETT